jgi:hypothetical protein
VTSAPKNPESSPKNKAGITGIIIPTPNISIKMANRIVQKELLLNFFTAANVSEIILNDGQNYLPFVLS